MLRNLKYIIYFIPTRQWRWHRCPETSAYKIQTPGELPRRKHTTFKIRRKFEIKNISFISFTMLFTIINPLTPNDPYRGRTAQLTSKRCILYIYSTNIGTEYFKHGIYSPFFSSKCSLFHNSNIFGSCIIHILYTGCAKIKTIIPAPKG